MSKYGPERSCGPLCDEHAGLAGVLGHDRVGHRSLMALLRTGLADRITELGEMDIIDVPGIGQQSVERILGAGRALRDGGAGV